MPRILWAEGSAPDHMFIQALLRQSPSKPSAEFVADGDELLQRIDQDAPDLVVLDLQLPDGQGLEALSQIQGRQGAPPVVVFTRAHGQATIDACRRLGASDVVRKPADFKEFREAVIGIADHPALAGR